MLDFLLLIIVKLNILAAKIKKQRMTIDLATWLLGLRLAMVLRVRPR